MKSNISNQYESSIKKYLEKHGFKVFQKLYIGGITDGVEDQSEIDLVAIDKNHILCIECKGKTYIEIRNGNNSRVWKVKNGANKTEIIPSPIRQNNRHKQHLDHYINVKLKKKGIDKTIESENIVVLRGNPELKIGISKHNLKTFDSLLNTLSNYEAERSSSELFNEEELEFISYLLSKKSDYSDIKLKSHIKQLEKQKNSRSGCFSNKRR